MTKNKQDTSATSSSESALSDGAADNAHPPFCDGAPIRLGLGRVGHGGRRRPREKGQEKKKEAGGAQIVHIRQLCCRLPATRAWPAPKTPVRRTRATLRAIARCARRSIRPAGCRAACRSWYGCALAATASRHRCPSSPGRSSCAAPRARSRVRRKRNSQLPQHTHMNLVMERFVRRGQQVDCVRCCRLP